MGIIPNFVSVTDSSGNTYTILPPNEDGNVACADLRDGTFLVVLRVKNDWLAGALKTTTVPTPEDLSRWGGEGGAPEKE